MDGQNSRNNSSICANKNTEPRNILIFCKVNAFYSLCPTEVDTEVELSGEECKLHRQNITVYLKKKMAVAV